MCFTVLEVERRLEQRWDHRFDEIVEILKQLRDVKPAKESEGEVKVCIDKSILQERLLRMIAQSTDITIEEDYVFAWKDAPEEESKQKKSWWSWLFEKPEKEKKEIEQIPVYGTRYLFTLKYNGLDGQERKDTIFFEDTEDRFQSYHCFPKDIFDDIKDEAISILKQRKKELLELGLQREVDSRTQHLCQVLGIACKEGN